MLLLVSCLCLAAAEGERTYLDKGMTLRFNGPGLFTVVCERGTFVIMHLDDESWSSLGYDPTVMWPLAISTRHHVSIDFYHRVVEPVGKATWRKEFFGGVHIMCTDNLGADGVGINHLLEFIDFRDLDRGL